MSGMSQNPRSGEVPTVPSALPQMRMATALWGLQGAGGGHVSQGERTLLRACLQFEYFQRGAVGKKGTDSLTGSVVIEQREIKFKQEI